MLIQRLFFFLQNIKSCAAIRLHVIYLSLTLCSCTSVHHFYWICRGEGRLFQLCPYRGSVQYNQMMVTTVTEITRFRYLFHSVCWTTEYSLPVFKATIRVQRVYYYYCCFGWTEPCRSQVFQNMIFSWRIFPHAYTNHSLKNIHMLY